MKNPSPREIVLISAGSVSAVMLLLLLLLRVTNVLVLPWWSVIAFPVVTFAMSYIIFFLYLERFIYRKVKVIYKTIHSLKAKGPKKMRGVDMSDDIMTGVEEEVVEWAKGQSKEIESLRQTAEFRKEFLSNVSHELKTPIFSIQGYLHTLIDGGLDDPKINKNYLYKASMNLDRLQAIVEDLELISQYESGQLNLEIAKFDVTALIHEVIEAIELQADLHDIEVKIKEDCDKSTNVLADKERIRQVLTNLMTNSIKYGRDGGYTTVGIYDMHDNILIEVSDNGIGISEEHLPRLFERFYRVDKSRSRRLGGTGLGLSIVKHIIEAHHQTINVRSTVDVGSTFGFTLKKA